MTLNDGEIFARLLISSRWVHREVETIRVGAQQRDSRSVSLDISVPLDLPLWHDPCLGVDAQAEIKTDAGRVAVPLGLLEKSPIPQLDATWEGKTVPVLTSQQNSEISESILKSLLRASELKGEAATQLEEIAKRAAFCSGRISDPDGSKLIRQELSSIMIGIGPLAEDQGNMLALFESFVGYFIDSFLMLVLLPASVRGHRTIVKFTRSEQQLDQKPSRFGWSTMLRFDRPLLWAGSSFHIEIEFHPSLSAATVEAEIFQTQKKLSGKPGSHHVHFVASEADRNYGKADIGIVARLVPNPQGIRNFTRWATMAVIACVTVTVILRWLPAADGIIRRPEFKIPSGGLSLLLVGPALFFSWQAREREHETVGKTLMPLRIILVLDAIILLIMGGLASLPVSQPAWNGIWMVVYLLTFGAGAWSTILFLRYWWLETICNQRDTWTTRAISYLRNE